MAKKRRTTRKPGRKEALAVIILTMLVGLARQMLAPSYDLSNIPDYDGTSAYAVIDRNQPSFTEEEYTTGSYEYYSELDSLGRCGVAEACVGVDLMPTEERESISKVKPTGWVQNQYDFVDGGNLYNRCHLIGFQLTGENANEKNLITGTRYMNVEGMPLWIPNWWPGAWRWRHIPWKIRAGASAFMSTATTCSPVWRSTMPPGRIGRHNGTLEEF